MKYLSEFEEEKWKIVAGRMGLTVRACQQRAKVLKL